MLQSLDLTPLQRAGIACCLRLNALNGNSLMIIQREYELVYSPKGGLEK